jgi:hypothetical protein
MCLLDKKSIKCTDSIEKICGVYNISVDIYNVRNDGGEGSNWIGTQRDKYGSVASPRLALAYFSARNHYELIVSKTQSTQEIKVDTICTNTYKFVPYPEPVRALAQTRVPVQTATTPSSLDGVYKFMNNLNSFKGKKPTASDLKFDQNALAREIHLIETYMKYCSDEKAFTSKSNDAAEKIVKGSMLYPAHKAKIDSLQNYFNSTLESIKDMHGVLVNQHAVVTEAIQEMNR